MSEQASLYRKWPDIAAYFKFCKCLQDVFCKYLVYLEENYTQTKPISNTTNPDFKHERVISMKGTPEVIGFYEFLRMIVKRLCKS